MAKKVIIIGAGPGGLTAGMILSHAGYQVVIHEKHSRAGGRNGRMTLGDFHFDIGPTFLMMPDVLRDAFKMAGRSLDDMLELKRIDPLYRLRFDGGRDFFPTNDHDKMKHEIDRLFPGDSAGFERYLEREGAKLKSLYPCLKVPYLHLKDYFRWRVIKALPKMDIFKSVYGRLGSYFKHDDMRIAMSFQSKYLGMSPWDCPATFTILSYIEHSGGIFHPIGGLNQISEAMSRVIADNKGQILFKSPVRRLIIRKGRVTGVELQNGDVDLADHVVINADFAHAMKTLVAPQYRKRWTNQKIESSEYSCSTFMIYLGLKKVYDLPHHNIVFAKDYAKNIEQVTRTLELPEDPSFYVQNPVTTDPTLAPEGKSTMYVLVPVPNLKSKINWEIMRESFRRTVLDAIKKKLDLPDLEDQIEVEQVVTPADWQDFGGVFRGAVFNLAHILSQMMYFRPHNRFEEFNNCYIVGGGTHPGSGLPTIYESGKIAAKLIQEADSNVGT